jgi:hypothetical protein
VRPEVEGAARIGGQAGKLPGLQNGIRRPGPVGSRGNNGCCDRGRADRGKIGAAPWFVIACAD